MAGQQGADQVANQHGDGHKKGRGVGASVLRKEDARLLQGRGRFIGDMRFPGQLEAAFVRSTLAHGRIKSIHIPPHLTGRAFTHADMVGVKDILAKTGLPGFRVSQQPSLASDKVRFVGEPVVMVLADTRAEAEDLCEEIVVEYEELGANFDMLKSARPDAARIHEDWPDNVFLVSSIDRNFDETLDEAPIKVTREVRTSRQCMAPLEGKGCIALFDRYVEQLTLWTSTQMPHIVRSGLAECLGMETRKIRVVAPDVGGGFGWKGLLQPEEVCCAWASLKLDRPIKWLEDRREHLIAAANCREHHYIMTAYADLDGKLLGLEAVAHVDAGAIPSTRSRRAWRARRWCPTCRGPTTFRPIAAGPIRCARTSRPSCRIAAWRAPACARRSS